LWGKVIENSSKETTSKGWLIHRDIKEDKEKLLGRGEIQGGRQNCQKFPRDRRIEITAKREERKRKENRKDFQGGEGNQNCANKRWREKQGSQNLRTGDRDRDLSRLKIKKARGEKGGCAEPVGSRVIKKGRARGVIAATSRQEEYKVNQVKDRCRQRRGGWTAERSQRTA